MKHHGPHCFFNLKGAIPMETTACITRHYEHYDEDSRLLSKTGKVEYTATMHYIQKYLRPGMRVLEIGAGTGRYSHALARMGYSVDAVELVQHNIRMLEKNTLPAEKLTVTQGNATNLAAFKQDTYDITLLLGPMYHLFTEHDKLQALSEAVRVTKKGGVIFAAYCMSDPAILSHAFIRGHVHSLMEKGMLDPITFRPFSSPQDIIELHRKEDIDALRSHFPVTQLHFVASDGLSPLIRDTLDPLDDLTYSVYLRYHLAICERPDMTGCSFHTLDIFRKD